MDGTNVTGGGRSGRNPGPSWHVKGAGDFNGDGKADILWQNDNGLRRSGPWMAPTPLRCRRPNSGPTWQCQEAADFIGDGKADILWQDDSGLPAIWTMSSAPATPDGVGQGG